MISFLNIIAGNILPKSKNSRFSHGAEQEPDPFQMIKLLYFPLSGNIFKLRKDLSNLEPEKKAENDIVETQIWEKLYNAAKAVQKERKLSPLMEAGSVGAALLTDKGNIYTGICIDTACGMGMCAERNAIANMLTNGESRIVKIAAVMPDGSSGTPCGVCREFMMQLDSGSKDIEILLSLKPLKTVRLGEQLPDWWGIKYS